MIRGLWFFFQLAILVLGAVWLARQNSPVSIEWRGWLLETTFGGLIASILVVAAIAALLWRLVHGLVRTPRAIGRVRLRRRRDKRAAALTRSFSAIAAGDGGAALRLASEAGDSGPPALAHLAAAEAASLAGDLKRAAAEYGRLSDRPDSELIGLRGLIGLAEGRGDPDEAIRLARRARKAAPKSPWAARRLFDLEMRAGALAEAERTLADATKLGAFSRAEADRLMARQLLLSAEAAETAGRGADALADAERAHELDPALIGAAVLGARLLTRSGRTPAAERMLTRAWTAAPDTALARAWMALAPGTDSSARLRQADRLYALNRDSAEAHLALAEAELAVGRWAEARAHLSALAGQYEGRPPTGRYCRLMAYLESASGNESAARSWFEKSLAAVETTPASPPAFSATAFATTALSAA